MKFDRCPAAVSLNNLTLVYFTPLSNDGKARERETSRKTCHNTNSQLSLTRIGAGNMKQINYLNMAMLRSYLKKVVRLSHALVSQLHSLYGQTGNRATADRPTRFSSYFFSWCSFVTPARLTTGILLLFGTSLQAADTLTLNLGNLLSYYTQTTDGY